MNATTPGNLNADAIRRLWKTSGKSASEISTEIFARYRVHIHSAAIRRAATRGTGIGWKKLVILADYFGVTALLLQNPDRWSMEPEKFLPESVTKY